MTKYTIYKNSNTQTGGCKVIPLNLEKARQWAEHHLDANNARREKKL